MMNIGLSEKTVQLIRQYRGEVSLKGRMAEPHRTLMEVSEDFTKYTDNYLLGDVMARPGLSLRERSMIIMAALAVNRYEVGFIVAHGHMRWAQNIGITREEVLEIIIIIAQYGGWPVGEEILDLLERAYPDYFKTTKEHKILSGLTLRERALVTMGALITRRFGDRLKKHIRFALKIGISKEEILETIMQVTPFTGWPVGVEAIRVAKSTFGSDNEKKRQISSPSERQKRGQNIIRQLCGDKMRDETFSLIEDVSPDFMKVVTEEHLFGEIWSRSLLSLRDRCMITLAILIAFRFRNDLKAHMHYALNVGLSKEEILETIMQSANYTCWGAGVEALRVAREVFGPGQKNRSQKYSSSELRDKGKKVIKQLHGSEERDELFTLLEEVCPDFIKAITEEHLFGEVWSRPGLNLRDRCMITIAILVARRFPDELKAHMRYALNVGISKEEIKEIILHSANYTCWGCGVQAIRASKDILSTIK